MHCMLYLVSHICTYAIDSAELKMEVQAVQVQWGIGGPQASSGKNANIVVIKASPSASNHNS
jgi:hypothetical protein